MFRRLFLPLQTKTVSVRPGAARVLNQSHAFFPNDPFEMTGGMARIVNTQIAFQADCGFP
jgi:hypothetical protein